MDDSDSDDWSTEDLLGRMAQLRKSVAKRRKMKCMDMTSLIQFHRQVAADLCTVMAETAALTTRKYKPSSITPNKGDVGGWWALPLRILFTPDKCFSMFTHNSIATYLDFTAFVPWCAENPDALTVPQINLLCKYLTVTPCEDECFMMKAVFTELNKRGKYSLPWAVLEEMLANLGCTGVQYEFEETKYYRSKVVASKYGNAPYVWNWAILFLLVNNSFRQYECAKLCKLIKFLADCLFEHQLVNLHFDISSILREVAVWMIASLNCNVNDLVGLIDQRHVDVACNVTIINCLACEPALKEVVKRLSFHTAFHVLDCDADVGQTSVSGLSESLTEFPLSREVVSAMHLVLVSVLFECSALFVDDEEARSALLDSVATFADNRLGALSTIPLNCVILYVSRLTFTRNVSHFLVEYTEIPRGYDVQSDMWTVPTDLMKSFMDDFVSSGSRCCSSRSDWDCCVKIIGGEFAEWIVICSNNVTLVVQTLEMYTSADVMVPDVVLHNLLWNCIKSKNDLKAYQAMAILLRYVQQHPPCRPGMKEYYLNVLGIIGQTNPEGGNTDPPERPEELFPRKGPVCMELLTQLQSRFEIVEKETTSHDLLQRTEREIEALSHLLNGVVYIMEHDFYSSVHSASVPIVIRGVWGNETPLVFNSHCLDVVTSFLHAPAIRRRTVGRYLTLLASALQTETLPKKLTEGIAPNDLSSSLVRTMIETRWTGDCASCLRSIPSRHFRMQVAQQLKLHNIPNNQ